MSKSTPKAPDYTAAAERQADSSREVTNMQTWANRPNQNTPFGSTTWDSQATIDPATGQPVTQWTQNTTLDPTSQAALESQLQVLLGRSQLAEGMTGRLASEYGSQVDWGQFSPMGQAPNVPTYGQGLPGTGTAPSPQVYDPSFLPDRGTGPSPFSLGALPGRGQAPTAGQYSPEQIQRGLSTQGLPDIDPSQRYYQDAGNAIYNQWAERALPEQARATEAQRTQLYNMGLKEGDKSYDQELAKLRMAQGDQQRQAAYQAMIGAGQEASRMFGMDSSARGQLFGERGTQGNFANQAAQQALMQQLGIGGQRFSEGMQLGGMSDDQRAAALGEFNQLFSQQLGSGQYSDAQRQAALAEMLGIGGQQFGEGMQAAQYANALRSQLGQEQLAFGGQQFGQQLSASNYQNQLRQQQIAEAMQQRGFSLNEINAILSGQQVAMPNMPSFSNAQRSDATNYLGAAQSQYQSALDAFNAQQAATQGIMSGVGSMAGAFMPSDRRLKSNVKRLGEIRGIPWYSYDIFGKRGVGVMADEVAHIPGVVAVLNGVSMVNYGVIYG